MFKRERGKYVGVSELLRTRDPLFASGWKLTTTLVWLGQADVKDAIHRLGMPSFLSRYVGYPGCTAEEMKMVGETVGDVRSLPMGA